MFPGSSIATVLCALLGVSIGELVVHVGTHTQKYRIGHDISPLDLSRTILRLPPAATVRFELLTAEEAPLLTSPICSRIDLDCWCDCYRNLGEQGYLMNNFGEECVRAIPASLFGGLRKEDMPMLGENFLKAMSPKQVATFKREARIALTDKQLIALISSDMNGLVESGANCAALTSEDIQMIENRPEVLKALTAGCVSRFKKRITAAGPKILGTARLFKGTPLSSLTLIPRERITGDLIQKMLESGSLACAGLTSEALALIPESKLSSLNKDCWNIATRENFAPFVIGSKAIQKLPSNAWSNVSARFLLTVKVLGNFPPENAKALLSTIGKDNIKACRGIYGLITTLAPTSAITLIPTECLLNLRRSHIRKIESSKIFNAFPADFFKSLSPSQVSEISPTVFKGLSEAHIKVLGDGAGCSGLRQPQLIALGENRHHLSLLTAKCVANIPINSLASLDGEYIAKFNDDAFSLLHRLDFDEDSTISGLLIAMRSEQIRALGEAHKDELYLCHNLQMDIAAVMTGSNPMRSAKRKTLLGPILVKNCLPVLHPSSMDTIIKEDLKYFGDSFLASFYRPSNIATIPEDLFQSVTQKQLDGIKPTVCIGLRFEQLANLPSRVKLGNIECIENMRPKDLVELAKKNRTVLPENVSTIFTLEHLQLINVSELPTTDYIHLGRNVPEALNPCRSIAATNVSTEFWKSVDEYCIASLQGLEKVDYKAIKEHVRGKTSLIGKAKAAILSKHGWELQVRE